MADRNIDQSDCELFLSTVRSVAGEAGVSAVQNAVGGAEIRVPLHPKPENWLAQAIGLEAAEKVCSHLRIFDADNRELLYPKIVVPLGSASRFKETIGEVDRLLTCGETARRIALRLRVHIRTVWRRRAKLVADGVLERRS